MQTALITGIRGQDASWLCKLLLEKDYKVIGTDRRSGSSDNWRLKELGIENHPNLIYEYMDITEPHNVDEIIKKYQPNELYQLAAQSFVGTSFTQPYVTTNVNYYGHLNILESCRVYSPITKIYFASTSETYGKVQEVPQTEKTPFYPRSPYGVAKLASFWLGVNYRESYGMFVSNGILFNHTSSLRGSEFVTQKIVKKLCEIKLSLQSKILFNPLEVGNIYAERDFSHAEDMVYGMWLILQMNIPDDYVLSSNQTIRIKDFINKVCEVLSIDIEWHNENKGIEEYATIKNTEQVIIKINSEFYRPSEVDQLLGNSAKAREILMWKPKYTLIDIIKEMVKAELARKI